MIYFFPLKWVAFLLGVLYLAGHMPGIVYPKAFGDFLKTLPRARFLGTLVMALATIWFCWVTSIVDLGEMAVWRWRLVSLWAAGGILTIIFVPNFLFPRGMGCLLMLGASVLLDAAFIPDTPWKYLITILAYVWVIAGLVFVYSPHLFRDAVAYAVATPERCRMFCWPGQSMVWL